MRPVRLIVAKRGFEIFEMCNDWFSRLLGISMKCCFTKQCKEHSTFDNSMYNINHN